MKITNREKLLLMILIFVLLVWGSYNFVLKKQFMQIKDYKVKKNEYKLKLEEVENKKKTKVKSESEIKVFNVKINDKTDIFMDKILQEKIIVIIDKFIKDSKINNSTLSFSNVTLENVNIDNSKKKVEDTKKTESELNKAVNDYKATVKKENTSNSNKKVETNIEAKKSENVGIESLEVSMDFKGSYGTLLAFLKELENNNKKVNIKNINISQGKDNELSGALVVKFYAVPKLDKKENDEKWEFEGPYGKVNPFGGGVATASVPQIANNEKMDIRYDFLMRVKPISSELPTVILVKADDETKKSCLYADNENIENVEIDLNEVNGKYFYKYKTSNEAYPKDFASNGVEFIPNHNELGIKIYTTERNSDKDVSGVNLIILNKTNKKLNVLIVGDDNSRPRVKISKTDGSVAVENRPE